MSANVLGQRFQLISFGESHGPAVGVVVDGVKPGLAVDLQAIQKDLDRRKPGQTPFSSPRREADRLEVLSGILDGVTTGGPICFVLRNEDAKPGHYEAICDVFRPGHGDYTWFKKFGIHDWRGGGRLSGRETATRVAAGALAKQLLRPLGVQTLAHVTRIGEVEAVVFNEDHLLADPLRCADPTASQRMQAAIVAAKADGDSLGGIVELRVTGVPAGWGDPVFQKLDAELAHAMVSIGAVKGVEFGTGFALAGMRGSEANDAMLPGDPPTFATNHAGGILGGISNGAPIVLRVVVKPTSAIRQEQRTITRTGEGATLRVPSRHDPCIAPRIVPVVEAMAAITLCDAWLRQEALQGTATTPSQLAADLAHNDQALAALLARRRQLLGQPQNETARQLLAEADGHVTAFGMDDAAARQFQADADRLASGLPPVPDPDILSS